MALKEKFTSNVEKKRKRDYIITMMSIYAGT